MVNRLIPMVAVMSLFAATCLSMNVNAAEPPHAALNDIGKLSSQGSAAFDDIERARIAIFGGRPVQATKLVKEAQDSLKIAHKDNTAFLKTESDLKPPRRAPMLQPR